MTEQPADVPVPVEPEPAEVPEPAEPEPAEVPEPEAPAEPSNAEKIQGQFGDALEAVLAGILDRLDKLEG